MWKKLLIISLALMLAGLMGTKMANTISISEFSPLPLGEKYISASSDQNQEYLFPSTDARDKELYFEEAVELGEGDFGGVLNGVTNLMELKEDKETTISLDEVQANFLDYAKSILSQMGLDPNQLQSLEDLSKYGTLGNELKAVLSDVLEGVEDVKVSLDVPLRDDKGNLVGSETRYVLKSTTVSDKKGEAYEKAILTLNVIKDASGNIQNILLEDYTDSQKFRRTNVSFLSPEQKEQSGVDADLMIEKVEEDPPQNESGKETSQKFFFQKGKQEPLNSNPQVEVIREWETKPLSKVTELDSAKVKDELLKAFGTTEGEFSNYVKEISEFLDNLPEDTLVRVERSQERIRYGFFTQKGEDREFLGTLSLSKKNEKIKYLNFLDASSFTQMDITFNLTREELQKQLGEDLEIPQEFRENEDVMVIVGPFSNQQGHLFHPGELEPYFTFEIEHQIITSPPPGK